MPKTTRKPRAERPAEEQAVFDRARKEIKLIRLVNGLSREELEGLCSLVMRKLAPQDGTEGVKQ